MLVRKREIKIRLTEDELDSINQSAKICGLNREKYCRSILNGTTPREAPPVDYYKLIREVRRVGSNIDQILKAARSMSFVDVPLLRKTLEDYHRTERMIWKAFDQAE